MAFDKYIQTMDTLIKVIDKCQLYNSTAAMMNVDTPRCIQAKRELFKGVKFY